MSCQNPASPNSAQTAQLRAAPSNSSPPTTSWVPSPYPAPQNRPPPPAGGGPPPPPPPTSSPGGRERGPPRCPGVKEQPSRTSRGGGRPGPLTGERDTVTPPVRYRDCPPSMSSSTTAPA